MAKKEFYTVEEVARQLGVQRSSLYHYIKLLKIPRHRFKLSRHSYIAAADVERIKQAKEEPWKVAATEEDEKGLS